MAFIKFEIITKVLVHFKICSVCKKTQDRYPIKFTMEIKSRILRIAQDMSNVSVKPTVYILLTA